MSASLVRKALDETTLAAEDRLDNLSKAVKKKFKPLKKKKKLSQDKIIKQNLKILKALECKYKSESSSTSRSSGGTSESKSVLATSGKKKSKKEERKSKKSSKKKQEGESVFTEEDFEKFEREYFVTE